MADYAALTRERDRLNAQIWRMEKERRAAELQPMVGRCFKYSNSYGQDERWWLYFKVTGTDNGWLNGFKFERTSQNEFQCEPTSTRIDVSRWIAIESAEFDRAWGQFVTDLHASAMSAFGQDPQGLEAKPASAAPEGGDAQ